MRTILERKDFEYIVEKSKFIGVVFPISSEDDFKNKLKNITKEYPQADHYCYAYKLGNKQKSNDDGEPSSTAGKPILEMILINNIDNVALIVIRYFGGIKLGAGGLTRAYATTANNVIKESKISEIIETKSFDIIYDYNVHDLIKRYLESNSIKIININYDVKIIMTIATNNSLDELINLVNGNVEIKEKETIDLII